RENFPVRSPMKRISILLAAATSFAVPACSSDSTNPGNEPQPDAGVTGDEWDQLLGQREVDFNAALRIAALRLTGDLPTMEEITRVASAPEEGKRAEYEAIVRDYLERPSFARQIFYFWRDTFKMGENTELDRAPAFAAQLSVENRSYLELFTATEN